MDANLERYIEAHSSCEPEWLYELNRRTNLRLLNGRMCSGPVQGRLLKMIVGMIRPMRALELGTFSGYSALCIAEGMPCDGKLDTIEADDELEDFILRGFASAPAGIAGKITLHIGPALDILSEMKPEHYDFIFIDADKREYSAYYESAMPLLRHGGYILADNTLWDGHVTDPAYSRDRQTQGVRAFNDTVAMDQRVEKVIIPLRDGLTLIRKL